MRRVRIGVHDIIKLVLVNAIAECGQSAVSTVALVREPDFLLFTHRNISQGEPEVHRTRCGNAGVVQGQAG